MNVDIDLLEKKLATIEEKDPPPIKVHVSYKVSDDTVVTFKSDDEIMSIPYGHLYSIIGIMDSGFVSDYESQVEYDLVMKWFEKMGVVDEEGEICDLAKWKILCDLFTNQHHCF